jgi:hypothetical protein
MYSIYIGSGLKKKESTLYKDFVEPTVDLNTDGRSRIVRPAPGPKKKIVEYLLLATDSVRVDR